VSLKEGLSVRAAERAAREVSGGQASRRSPAKGGAQAARLDPDTRAFVEQIERRLQTKVALHPGPGGAGRLEIKYFSLEDLERIGGLLLGESV
jgi:ParB family chromosome partitioning protein